MVSDLIFESQKFRFFYAAGFSKTSKNGHILEAMVFYYKNSIRNLHADFPILQPWLVQALSQSSKLVHKSFNLCNIYCTDRTLIKGQIKVIIWTIFTKTQIHFIEVHDWK